jgi:hypothetical protein
VEKNSCPALRGIDEVGSAMESVKQGEDDAEEEIHDGERLAAGTCVGATCAGVP